MGQELVDGSFDFQTDPAKLYSAYIPSTYDAQTPNTTIIAFHPFNTNRWDAAAWRDTLIVFAESVNAILLCPDGGIDGKVDDPIDTAFTSFLLDTMSSQYNIDPQQTYLCGFSWGGRTAYTYGLHRPNKFKGYLITGAAVNGTTEVNDVLSNAAEENFYLIHGTNDNLNNRHTIISNALLENDACVESNILMGVNHTIDYPNRNQILKDGFDYLLANACVLSSSKELEENSELELYPNPARGIIQIRSNSKDYTIEKIMDTQGRLVSFTSDKTTVHCFNYIPGLHFVQFLNNENKRIIRKIILE